MDWIRACEPSQDDLQNGKCVCVCETLVDGGTIKWLFMFQRRVFTVRGAASCFRAPKKTERLNTTNHSVLNARDSGQKKHVLRPPPPPPEPIKRHSAAGAAGAAIHSNKGCRDKDAARGTRWKSRGQAAERRAIKLAGPGGGPGVASLPGGFKFTPEEV